MQNVPWLIAIVCAYLCGSIPFGLWIGLSRGVDLRKVGSGNIGATNCGRVLGKKIGILCFVLDLLKGTLPVVLAGAWFGMLGDVPATRAYEWLWISTSAAAVLGHVFPIWLGFRGGKGVATGLGAVLGVWPVLTLPALAAAVVWLVFAGTLRYVGLASVVAAVCLPPMTLILGLARGRSVGQLTPFLVVTGVMALLIVVRHRGNLARVWRGTEPKLGLQR